MIVRTAGSIATIAACLTLTGAGVVRSAPLTTAERAALMQKVEAGETLSAEERAVLKHWPKRPPPVYLCVWHENTNGTPFGVSGQCYAPPWPAGTPCTCGSSFHDSGQTVHNGTVIVTREGHETPIH